MTTAQSMRKAMGAKGSLQDGSTNKPVVRNAASILSGTFKPKSKEMIASEQRAKKTKSSKAAKAKAYLGGGTTPGGPSNHSNAKPQGAWATSSAVSQSTANTATPKGPPPSGSSNTSSTSPSATSSVSKKSKAAAYLGGTTPGGPSSGTTAGGPPPVQRSAR